MKRLTIAVAVAAAALVIGGADALARGGPPAKDTFAVSFTLTSDQCPNLPAGTTITGTGTGKSITQTHTDADGSTTIANVTHDFGTAVDQAGNQYHFSYSNEFRVSDAGSPGQFSGRMTDHFGLSGPGPARLDNGFVAGFSTDFVTFSSLDPISSHGDPISFPDGAAICDPL